MAEFFQKKTLQRSMKPTPLLSLIRGGNNSQSKKNKDGNDVRLQSLGSGVTLPISPSLVVTPNNNATKKIPERTLSAPSRRNEKRTREHRQSWIPPSSNDKYIPSIQSRFSYCPSPAHTTFDYETDRNRHYSYYGGNSRPMTPVLSPSDTRYSFYTSIKSPLTPDSSKSTEFYPTKSKKRSSTWKPVPSISSSEEEDDDEIPLGKIGIIPEGIESLSQIKRRSSSLLSTFDEDGDDELIPIGSLSSCKSQSLSAAEKYKARVQAKLNMVI